MSDNTMNVISHSYVYAVTKKFGEVEEYYSKNISASEYKSFKEALRNEELRTLKEEGWTSAERPKIDLDSPDVITPEKFEEMMKPVYYLFEPTGDPKQDKIIELTLLYRRSCVDYTYSAEFEKLTEEMDLTGMSNAEKYKAIYEKYQYCYGENFADVGAINYPLFGLEYGTQFHIYSQFEDEVIEACGGIDAAQKARRDALYGKGLKASEVRQEIIDKYYYEGMTLRDLLKMTNEMRLCGVDGGITNLLDPLSNIPGTYFNNESTDQYEQIMNREAILDEPVSKGFLQKMYNSFKARAAVSSAHPDLPEIVGKMMDLFDAYGIEGGIRIGNDMLTNIWSKFK